MSARYAIVYFVAFAWMWGAEPASGQSNGAFDGKWIGESSRCFPATNTYRFTNLVVKNNAFSWVATDAGRKSTCKVTINRDGSFEAQNCAFALTGKFEGNKVSIRRQTNELTCEIVAKRE